MSPMPDISGDRCDRCGKRLNVAAVFCPRCGNRVRDFALVADDDAELAAIVEGQATATSASAAPPPIRRPAPPSRVLPYRSPATRSTPLPLGPRASGKKTGLWPLLVVAFIALRAVSVVSRSPSFSTPVPPIPPPPPAARSYAPPPSAPQFPSRTLPKTFPNPVRYSR